MWRKRLAIIALSLCIPSMLFSMNSLEPAFADPASGDFHLASDPALLTGIARAIPDFVWDNFTPAVPAGELSNGVASDWDGFPRAGPGLPGAFGAPAPSRIFLPILMH